MATASNEPTELAGERNISPTTGANANVNYGSLQGLDTPFDIKPVKTDFVSSPQATLDNPVQGYQIRASIQSMQKHLHDKSLNYKRSGLEFRTGATAKAADQGASFASVVKHMTEKGSLKANVKDDLQGYEACPETLRKGHPKIDSMLAGARQKLSESSPDSLPRSPTPNDQPFMLSGVAAGKSEKIEPHTAVQASKNLLAKSPLSSIAVREEGGDAGDQHAEAHSMPPSSIGAFERNNINTD